MMRVSRTDVVARVPVLLKVGATLNELVSTGPFVAIWKAVRAVETRLGVERLATAVSRSKPCADGPGTKVICEFSALSEVTTGKERPPFAVSRDWVPL